MAVVGLVVALPEEARVLARVIRDRRQRGDTTSDTRCQVLGGVIGRRRVLLTWAGAGAAAADRAALAALRHGAGALLSVGFAGALVTELHVGDLVLASEVLEHGGACWETDAMFRRHMLTTASYQAGRYSSAAIRCDDRPPHAGEGCRGRLVTVARIVADVAGKRALQEETGGIAVDMESAAIARRAAAAGVPMAALRVITDGAEQALPPELETCFDSAGQFQRARLLRVLARRPGMATELMRLGRHASQAGRRLASFLEVSFS